ncbi:hypothetical protein MTP99_011767 [Tenebrio molitor]|nr:hypothetical protein MTP99_011767 [Tenebrio molitor]
MSPLDFLSILSPKNNKMVGRRKTSASQYTETSPTKQISASTISKYMFLIAPVARRTHPLPWLSRRVYFLRAFSTPAKKAADFGVDPSPSPPPQSSIKARHPESCVFLFPSFQTTPDKTSRNKAAFCQLDNY